MGFLMFLRLMIHLFQILLILLGKIDQFVSATKSDFRELFFSAPFLIIADKGLGFISPLSIILTRIRKIKSRHVQECCHGKKVSFQQLPRHVRGVFVT